MKTPGTRNQLEILGAPDFVQSVVLSSGVGQAFDTPTGAGFCSFSMNADYWVRYGSTSAVAPTTSSTGSGGSELNPAMRNITSTASCTGISIYSDYPCKGSIAWFHV
jgi:hypothetical protein